MASQALEKFVRRVFAEAGFRARFVSHPEEALAGFDLAREEREALTRHHLLFDMSAVALAVLAARVDPLVWWLP